MSTKFKFRFQSVAKVRKIEMEQQAKVVSLLMKKIADVKQEIENLKQLDRDEILRIQTLTLKGVFIEQMTLVSRSYRDGLRLQVKQKREELGRLHLQAEEEEAKLLEKQKQKKILDKVEERERENHEKEVKASERKEMDEIASVLRSFSPK